MTPGISRHARQRTHRQVRNEIKILKKVSEGHPNIVQLHDFFETTHNLYVSGQLEKRAGDRTSFRLDAWASAADVDPARLRPVHWRRAL